MLDNVLSRSLMVPYLIVTFGQVRVSLVNTSMSQEWSTFNGVLRAFEPMEKHTHIYIVMYYDIIIYIYNII